MAAASTLRFCNNYGVKSILVNAPGDNAIFSHNGEYYAFKNVNNCLNTNIYSYLDTSGGQSSNQCLNVVHFFNASVN
jgi:hypothetical protein